MIKEKEIPYVSIDKVQDLITEVDTADLSSDFALRTRGFRHLKKGTLGERDWGTINRFPSYPAGISIIKLYTLYIQPENKEYEVLVGLDATNNMRIYVDDGTGAGNWTELTQTSTGVVTSVSTTTVNYTTTDTIADLSNWLVTNELIPYSALAVSGSSGAGTGSVVLVNNNDASGSNSAFVVGANIKLYRYTGILSDVIFGGNPANSNGDVARGYRFSNGAFPHIRFLGVQPQQKVTMFYGDSNTPTSVRQQIQIRKGKFQTPNSFTIGGGTGWTKKSSPSGSAIYGIAAIGRGTITNATNASPIVISIADTTNLANGQTIFISGVTGNTAANGKWVIANLVVNTSFELAGSTGNAPYVSGGVIEYAWECDGDGKTFYSRDGGDTWTFVSASPGFTLRRIRFLDYNTGWTVGTQRIIRKTTNAGGAGPSWVDQAGAIAAGAQLYDVSIVDANNVFICGYDFVAVAARVYSTTTGAAPWTSVSTGLGNSPVIGIYALTATNVYICTLEGKVWHTTNGGTTWTQQLSVPGKSFNSIQFFDANTGWVCGSNGLLYKTTNGGTNWNVQSVPVFGSLNDIDIVDATHVKIAHQTGVISTSDGNFWTSDVFVDTVPVLCIDLVDFNNGYAAGNPDLLARLSGNPGVAGSGAASGWYVDKAGLIPDFKVPTGCTRTTPRTAASPADPTVDIGEGIRFSLTYQEQTDVAAQGYFVRMYATALYAGVDGITPIQESDPIFQVFINPSALNKFASAQITIKIDPSKINKNIVGFRFYEARKRAADVGGLNAVANWAEDSADYLAVYDALYSTPGWALDVTQQFCYSLLVNQFGLSAIDLAFAGSPNTINTNLGHFPIIARTYLTSRFAVKLARDQGALVILDQDNTTLRFSCYNGKGVHMDDSFPNESTDILGNKLIEPLQTKGDMMGLTTNSLGNVAALFTGEMEVVDLIQNTHYFLPIDCVSKESITGIGLVDAPAGTVWAGKSAVYFYPSDGSEIRPINLNWMNLYDGTLLTPDNVTPYINDDFRKGCITGYDPTYRDVWFAIQTARETPNAIAITGATNVSPIVITAAGHQFSSNDLIYINGIIGNTAANGSWIITKIDANTFSLNGSTGNGAYSSGGTAIQTEILSYRYSITSNRLSVRRIAAGAGGYNQVKCFSRRNDNTFTIAYPGGILKYPNRDATRLPYQDDVLITTDGSGNITGVTTQNRGIDTLLRLNIGAIYNLQDIIILAYGLFDHSGGVANNLRDLMSIAFTANDEALAFTTIQVPIGVSAQRYFIERHGSIRKLKIEITLPSATITNFGRLELKKIQLGYVPRKIIGNN